MVAWNTFVHVVVQGLGHTGSSAQLYSAFPYMSASVLVMATAYVADRLQSRGPIVLALLPVTMVGCTSFLDHIHDSSLSARWLIYNIFSNLTSSRHDGYSGPEF